MTDKELEQYSARLKQLPKRIQQIRESKATVEGLKQRPYQTELTSLLYLLEDVVTVYERYKAVNLTQSDTITEILEKTIKGICNYIANDFE